jgi:hypothetical protein
MTLPGLVAANNLSDVVDRERAWDNLGLNIEYPGQDRFYNQVSLLLHGDGTNGSTTITDSSPSPKAVTAVGNAQISTAQSKFGGSSIAFPGGVTSWLSAPNVTDLALLSDNFTIELWVYFATVNNEFLFWNSNAAAFGGIRLIQIGTADLSLLASTNGSAHTTNVVANSVLSLNSWKHIAASRQGSTLRIFVDGVLAINTTIVGALNNGGINNVGGRSVFPFSMNGYIDDFRVTKGIARYTANFTPPTAPFPDSF